MFKRSLSLLLSGALLLSLLAAPASAKTKEEKAAEMAPKVKAGIAKLGVGKGAWVSLKLRDKTKLTGYVSKLKIESDRQSLSLCVSGLKARPRCN